MLDIINIQVHIKLKKLKDELEHLQRLDTMDLNADSRYASSGRMRQNAYEQMKIKSQIDEINKELKDVGV